MKKLNLSLSLTAVVSFALALHGRPASAQQTAAATPQQQAAPASPTSVLEQISFQVSFQEETFSLPAKDAVALLRDVRDDRERYDRVVAMAAQGKARIERLIVLRVLCGDRAVSTSVGEYRYPGEYGPASFRPPQRESKPDREPRTTTPTDPEIVRKDIISAAGPTPTGFPAREVGDVLEIEPQRVVDGKTIWINVAPRHVRYAGEREIKGPNPVQQPIFEDRKLTTSVSLTNGRPFLLGTLNPPANDDVGHDQAERPVWLDFLTGRIVTPGASFFAQEPVSPTAQGLHDPAPSDPAVPAAAPADSYRKEAAPTPPDQELPPPLVSLTQEVFSLPVADAFALLRETADDAERYRRLVRMTTEGKAKTERLTVIRTRSGEHTLDESVNVYRFPAEYGPATFSDLPRDDKGNPRQALPTDPEIVHKDVIAASGPTPKEFEEQNVGETLEFEPVISPDGRNIALNMFSKIVRYIGDHETQGSNPIGIPNFETQKVVTAVSTKNGEPFLLGTISPPWQNGIAAEQAEHRIWLDFMTCQALWDGGSAEPDVAPEGAPKH